MTTWQVARESNDLWVGPITVTIAGTPVDPANLAFAVLAGGHRPTDSDWTDPVANPGGSGVGVVVNAVDLPELAGIWARITNNAAELVLEPDQVGFINRT